LLLLLFLLHPPCGGASFLHSLDSLFSTPTAAPTSNPTSIPTKLPTSIPTTFEGGAIKRINSHLHAVQSEIANGLNSTRLTGTKALVDKTIKQAALSLNKTMDHAAKALAKMSHAATTLEAAIHLAPRNLSVASERLNDYAEHMKEELYKDCASSEFGAELLHAPNPELTIGNFTCNLQSVRKNAQYVAGISVTAACTVSFVHIMALLCSNEQPQFRKYFIRIVLMVPVYAINAYYALKSPRLSFIYGLGRCAYEAFVLYSFVQFLLTAVGGPSKLARTLRRQQLDVQRKKAAKSAGEATPDDGAGADGGGGAEAEAAAAERIWEAADDDSVSPEGGGGGHGGGGEPAAVVSGGRGGSARFVRCTLLGTLQYVPAMGMVIGVSYYSNLKGQFQEGEFDSRNVWVWCSIVQGVSQTWALTCLALFYQAVKEQLHGHRPLLKFVCIKLVVFFTW
jgi:hypothetical protein